MLCLCSHSQFLPLFIECWPTQFQPILSAWYSAALRGEQRNFNRTLIPSSLAAQLHYFQLDHIYKASKSCRSSVTSTIEQALVWLHSDPALPQPPPSTNVQWSSATSPFNTSDPKTRPRSHPDYAEPKPPKSVNPPPPPTKARPHEPESKCMTGSRPAGQGLETNRHCGWVVGAS